MDTQTINVDMKNVPGVWQEVEFTEPVGVKDGEVVRLNLTFKAVLLFGFLLFPHPSMAESATVNIGITVTGDMSSTEICRCDVLYTAEGKPITVCQC